MSKLISEIVKNIKLEQNRLVNHQVYKELNSIESLRVFSEVHCFAVWDFMSLLKSLQAKLTCIDIPWTPKTDKKIVRLINEIVLSEESDLDFNNNPLDHFTMYLYGMKEINASTSKIESFLDNLDMSLLPKGIKEFNTYTLDVALNGKDHEVAGAFLFGRETLIPLIFERIENALNKNNLDAKYLRYYFKRHIELDSNEHSKMAEEVLNLLCGTDETKLMEAYNAGLNSLKYRSMLWDYAVLSMKQNSDLLFW